MYSNTILYLTIIYLLIFTLTNGKTISKDFELTGENASLFLYTTTTDEPSNADVDKREMGTNCVPCKFGINPCCDPNVCVKKTLWPDECMEIKRAKPHRQPHFD